MEYKNLLLNKLGSLRRRIRFRMFLRIVLASFSGLALGLIGFGILPALAPEAARPFFAGGFLTAGLAASILLSVLALRQAPRATGDLTVARTLTAGNEPLRNLIESGADVARWSDREVQSRGASAALVQAHVLDAGRAAASIDETRVPLPGPLGLWLVSAGLTFVLLSGLIIARPDGFRVSWSSLTRRSAPAAIDVVRLRVTLLPPAYTGLPESVTEGDGTPVRGLPGTRVALEADLSGRATSGVLETPSGATVAADIQDKRLSVAWLLDKPGFFRLAFRKGDQPVPSDFPAQPVEIVEDARPEVNLETPVEDIRVTRETEVEVKFTASDDFGVGRAEIVLSGREEVRIPVSIEPGKAASGSARFLPLAYEKLGDGAHLYVEVQDNDTISGPKKAASRSVYLSFVDRKGILADIEGLEERLFEALIVHLADHLEGRGSDPAVLTRLRSSASNLLALFRELVERISADTETMLSPASITIVAMQAGLESTLQPFIDGGTDRSRIVPELERDILLLDRLRKNLQMESVLSMGEEAAALQRQIFESLDKGKDPQSLMPLLDRLMRQMNRMMQKLSEGQESMPEDFMNTDAVKDMPESELEQAMKKLKEALAKGDSAEARKAAEELLELMSEWMQALEAAASESAKSSMGQSMSQMNELDQQVKELIERQEKVLEGTRSTSDQAGRPKFDPSSPASQNILRQIEERLNRISNQVRSMEGQRSGMHAMPPGAMHGMPNQPPQAPRSTDYFEKRNRMNTAMSEIRNRLQSDPNGARETVPYLEKAFEDVTADLTALDQKSGGQKTEAIQQGRKEGLKDIDGLKKDLDSLMGREGQRPQLPPGAAEKLAQLAGEQGQLGDKTSQLQQKLKDLLRNVPFLPGGLPEKAGQVRQNMDSARGQLQGQNPQGAIPSETSALEGLSEIAGEFQKARKQMQSGMGKPGGFRMSGMTGSGMPGGQGGNGQDVDRSRVDIPKETQEAEIRGFREDIMKAMRSGRYPKDYKADVEAYYEKLIK